MSLRLLSMEKGWIRLRLHRYCKKQGFPEKAIYNLLSALGLHEAVIKRADFKLSFSDMTFPHQLMRVILCEQIYRGYRIMSGAPYHK